MVTSPTPYTGQIPTARSAPAPAPSASTTRYSMARCSLGFVIIAASANAIRCIMLGTNPDALVRDVKNALHGDELEFHGQFDSDLIAKVIRLIEDPSRAVNLPLDIRGTEFQRSVWDALRHVPAGTTLSYGALAKQIGAPRAVRAVARACAANTVAVAVPCHRAVRADGELGGYRWGIDRKRALIEREARK
jgi:AraC family transcriptional regulator, regulatory protein of adaptative response / methylated-DNA-[protein]-cysteine methyltransferase